MFSPEKIRNQTNQNFDYNNMIRLAEELSGNLKSRFRENLTMLIIILLISLLTIFGS